VLKLEARLARIEQLLVELVTEQRGRPATKEFYSTAEFAEIVGRAEWTVRNWCRTGRIVATKPAQRYKGSSEWLISHDELVRYHNRGLLPPPRPGR
jgi:hypothetical protein